MRYALLLSLILTGTLAFGCSESNSTPVEATYGLSVGFNPDTTTRPDIDDVENYLRDLDEDVELLSEDSLPPIFHATWTTSDDSPCDKITSELESRPYVAKVDCREVGRATPAASPTG